MKPEKGKAGYTATPWHRANGRRDSEFDYLMGPKGKFIAEIDVSDPEGSANIDFICKAVNAHEENEAAKKRLDWIVSEPEGARHLLQLLSLGKGTDKDFLSMIDRIIASKAQTIICAEAQS